MLAPLLISTRAIESALKRGDAGVSEFLGPLVDEIEAAWRGGYSLDQVVLACRTIRFAFGGAFPSSVESARLLLLEARAALAVAVSEEDAERAFTLAEQVVMTLSAVDVESETFLLMVGEALLVEGVALKAIGMRDESIDLMRLEAQRFGWNSIESVPLERQEVMMFQDHERHLDLLVSASSYRESRPVEYFRTVKRVVEFLLAQGYSRAAGELADEYQRAYVVALPDLSTLARVSFLKNACQLMAVRGEVYRSRKLLAGINRLASQLGFRGQVRQIQNLALSVGADVALPLPTFELPR